MHGSRDRIYTYLQKQIRRPAAPPSVALAHSLLHRPPDDLAPAFSGSIPLYLFTLKNRTFSSAIIEYMVAGTGFEPAASGLSLSVEICGIHPYLSVF